MGVEGWLRAGLLVLLLFAIFMRFRHWYVRYKRGGAGDRSLLEEARSRQQSVEHLAAERGWTIRQRGQVEGRAFPPRLRSDSVEVGTCDFAIEGEGFHAESWTAYTGRPGSPMTSAIRQHLLYVDAGGIDVQVVMRDLPVVFTPQLMPSLFRGRTAADTPGQLVAAGDFEQVRQRIEPLLGRIVQSRTWVVALDQAVTVMAHWEPDAEEFEAWLQLGRDVRAALERPSTGEVQPRPTPTSDPIR